MIQKNLQIKLFIYIKPRVRKIARINRKLVISAYSSENLIKDGIKILKKLAEFTSLSFINIVSNFIVCIEK